MSFRVIHLPLLGLGFFDTDIQQMHQKWYTPTLEKADFTIDWDLFLARVPRRFATSQGTFIRVSDITAGHCLARDPSDCKLVVVNVTSSKITQIIYTRDKAGTCDHLCYISCQGNYIIYKISATSPEIILLTRVQVNPVKYCVKVSDLCL